MTVLSATVRVRSNEIALAAVAVGFAVLQVATMSLSAGLEYDEVVYLSQLNPDVPAFPWGSHRAWGTSLLTTPVAVSDAPLPIVRLYLAALSSIGLFLAYRPWLVVRDSLAVPLAAGLFASTYAVTYYGVMARPNYFVALGAVAATGYFLSCRDGAGSRWAPVGLATAVAVTALLRPSDSLWLVVPLGLAWLGWRAWRRPSVVVAIGVGQLVGWAPWIVEAFARFGGPVERLREAGELVGGGGLHLDLTTVELYLRMWSAGQLTCDAGGGEPCALAEPIGLSALAWWLAAGVLIAIGVVGAVRAGRAAEGVLPLAVGLALAFSYLFMLRYGALRFLLPAGAVLALPAAAGLLLLARPSPPRLRAVGAVLAAAVVLAHLSVHVLTADQLGESAVRAASERAPLVGRLREVGITPPCLLVGVSAHVVAYELGCGSRGSTIDHSVQEPAWVRRARADGTAVVAVVRSAPSEQSYLEGWRTVEVDPPSGRGWTVYLAPK